MVGTMRGLQSNRGTIVTRSRHRRTNNSNDNSWQGHQWSTTLGEIVFWLSTDSVFCFFNGSIFDVIGQKLVSWNYKIFDYVNRTRIYINFNRYVRCRLIQLISRSNVQVIDCVCCRLILLISRSNIQVIDRVCCRLILLISSDNIHVIISLNKMGQIIFL
jgi:hypothetical protein